RLPQLRADTDVFTTFEGDNTVLLQLVGKSLLTNYRQEFGSLDTLGTAKFVAGQFLGTVIERTAARSFLDRLRQAAPGRDGNADLFDREWQRELLEDREAHVLEGLARRLRGTSSSDAFAAFNGVLDHVLLAARAHVDRLVFEAFTEGIGRVRDEGTRRVLERLCDLFVLSLAEEERAWFLEHERFTPARAKAVTSAVNSLCRRLRPHARALVDGFGLPDEWLGAPIALGAEEARQDAQARARVPVGAEI
ncbi:acyl-CoA dehydrogenase, partial [Thermobifida halotolerans]